MSRLPATLKLDVRLQARSRLYAVGIPLAVVLGIAMRIIFDREHAGRALPALYLLGLGGTSYIFAAALVLMEKSQGTLNALRTTPLTSNTYIASKVITLGIFAAIEAAVIFTVGFFGAGFAPIPLVVGVLCLGAFNTFVGLAQVASYDSVTAFLMPGALLVGMVLQWPVFYVLDLGPSLLWHLIPTQGPLLLMMGAFQSLEAWQWVYGFSMSLGSIAVAAWWAKRRFARFIQLGEG